jgi:hypothetical protein
MQIAAILVLTSIGFTWDYIASAQNYKLLPYLCLGMPYFAFPFSNSILSKMTDARNASFYQGVSYAALQTGILISRTFRCKFREHKRTFDHLLFCVNVCLVASVDTVCCITSNFL